MGSMFCLSAVAVLCVVVFLCGSLVLCAVLVVFVAGEVVFGFCFGLLRVCRCFVLLWTSW